MEYPRKIIYIIHKNTIKIQTMICMLLNSKRHFLWYRSTPKYLVRRSIVLCHHPGGRTIHKWPSPYGLFKVGKVPTIQNLPESLQTIQSWPSHSDYSKLAESLRTIQSWPCPHRPSPQPRDNMPHLLVLPQSY
jgi:hypothetical protein